jgi:hypothetical protein
MNPNSSMKPVQGSYSDVTAQWCYRGDTIDANIVTVVVIITITITITIITVITIIPPHTACPSMYIFLLRLMPAAMPR